MINTNKKQWINTSVEYQWSDELGKLVEISKEGYWYEGEMELAVGQTIAHSQSSDWSLIVKNTYDTETVVSMGWSDLNAMHINAPAASGKSNYLIHAVSGNGCNFQITGDGSVGMGVSASNILHPLHVVNENGGYQCLFQNYNGAAKGVQIKIKANDSGGESKEALDVTTWDSGSTYTSKFKVRRDGKVAIGNITPSYALEVSGTFYSSGSSIEYKQDVEPYTPPEGALMSLNPVQYDYKDEWKAFGKRYAGNSSKQLGFVAEDVAKILPELAVTKSEDGKEVVRNVDYEKLTVLLVSEVQNLRKELNELKRNSGNN